MRRVRDPIHEGYPGRCFESSLSAGYGALLHEYCSVPLSGPPLLSMKARPLGTGAREHLLATET